MTEGHESDFLVTVRAQVMTRDESTEGWLPLAGGGLANVSIRKRARLSPGAAGHEYLIYGQRISDQSVILSCVINRDLKYYKVMPTFHHWRAGKQRNGLTFQTAADARAFDKGVIRAYNELIDDDVFMTLDLPVEAETIQRSYSSPEGSEKSQKSFGDRYTKDTGSNKSNATDKSERIHYISSEKSCMHGTPLKNFGSVTTTNTSPLTSNVNVNTVCNIESTPVIAPSENYSYVTLTAVHDYNYPVVDQPATAQVLNARRESISAVKKRNALEAAQALAAAAAVQSSPISAAILKDHQHHVDVGLELMKKNQRIRCQYCHELYSEEWNRNGACEFAPDCFRSGFECISGMGCARCMVYHCMSDAEGETTQHPCECVNEPGCTKRWIGLTLLSLIVPCLWCYPPLRACHWIGVSCGICGGKHKPQV